MPTRRTKKTPNFPPIFIISKISFFNHVNLRNPQNCHFHRNKKPRFRITTKQTQSNPKQSQFQPIKCQNEANFSPNAPGRVIPAHKHLNIHGKLGIIPLDSAFHSDKMLLIIHYAYRWKYAGYLIWRMRCDKKHLMTSQNRAV